ncbi:DUF502 domain-containing protein [Alkaliphilus sp. MSJ-5]|uniref:DUF502 domain-containing protein n=1 Tax=Alkaliphilus flagellatus TaxID=2841507 RepID=A0ABS6G0F4_9FIRM|nr:DUF502 domain-containing protein [Alkaliphilus flagellatus]MBU5675679.1 DUF502 domain-containing protein [Alkaliphilus flagellatus]
MWKEIRKTFLTGLLVMIPLIITVYTILWFLNKVDSIFRRPIEELLGFTVYGLGIIITIGIVLLAGIIATNYAGHKLFGTTEYFLKRIPLVRSIYFPIKQLTETIYGSANTAFRRVVLVQYPSLGIYTIGFITSEGIEEVADKTGKPVVCVFIPTTPNPTSGMFVMVPSEDLIALDMGVEDAIKLVVSGGIAKPSNKDL